MASARDVLHDTRNVVTAARLYVQVIEQCLSTPRCPASEIREALRVIESNLEHAAMLLATKPRLAPSRLSDLGALARDAVAQVPPERAKDVSVRWFEEDAPVGAWDSVAITRILTNLLDNAAKYSLTGTSIVVEIVRGDASVEVAVRDRGVGVPEPDLEAIFDGHRTGWARAMADGQDRGLRSSRGLAEALGGRLWATREAHGGLSIHLQLPLTPARLTFPADPRVDGPAHQA